MLKQAFRVFGFLFMLQKRGTKELISSIMVFSHFRNKQMCFYCVYS